MHNPETPILDACTVSETHSRAWSPLTPWQKHLEIRPRLASIVAAQINKGPRFRGQGFLRLPTINRWRRHCRLTSGRTIVQLNATPILRSPPFPFVAVQRLAVTVHSLCCHRPLNCCHSPLVSLSSPTHSLSPSTHHGPTPPATHRRRGADTNHPSYKSPDHILNMKPHPPQNA